MSGNDPHQYKTNYFGSFLDTMNDRPKAPQPVPETPLASHGADPVLRELNRRGGRAALKDLLPVTDYSVDRLMANVRTLDTLGLVRTDGRVVDLTRSGQEVAVKMTT